jgi:hypothetical protein
MKQERLLFETNAVKLFITAQSRVRLEYAERQWEFELIEDAIEFIGLHPEIFDSGVYNEFFDTLMRPRLEP